MRWGAGEAWPRAVIQSHGFTCDRDKWDYRRKISKGAQKMKMMSKGISESSCAGQHKERRNVPSVCFLHCIHLSIQKCHSTHGQKFQIFSFPKYFRRKLEQCFTPVTPLESQAAAHQAISKAYVTISLAIHNPLFFPSPSLRLVLCLQSYLCSGSLPFVLTSFFSAR